MVEDEEVEKYTKNEQHRRHDTKKAMGEKEEKELNGGWRESQNLGERCNVVATRVVERVQHLGRAPSSCC